MNKQQDGVLFFGFPEEAQKFQERHPMWGRRFPDLVRALDMAFVREQEMSTPEDKLVYFFGRMCLEDFMEILLVCGNGYGAAGQKLLRSIYEHAVTLRYIHEHPEEAKSFMDYHHVQQYKLMKPIIETFGKEILCPEIVAEVERKYEEVKERFMVSDCKRCGTKRVNHNWNKLDFVAMARKAGAVGRLIVPGYFLPLRHAHTTFFGLRERLEIRDSVIGFQRESEPKLADEALMIAHHCVIDDLEVQNERFKIEGLAEQIQTCLGDFLEIWVPDFSHRQAGAAPFPFRGG